MADLQSLTCPNCGAALTSTGDEPEIKCEYCGTTVRVPGAASAPAPVTQIVIEPTGFGGSSRPSRAVWLVPLLIGVAIFCLVGVIISSVMTQVSRISDSALAPFADVLTAEPTRKAQQSSSSRPAPTIALPATDTPEPTETPEPTATSTPTRVPLPTPQTYAKVVVRDDFSNPKSGWDRTTAHGNSMNYADNGYLISVNGADSGETSWIKDGLKDVSVEVDEETQSGAGWVGVMCRIKQNVGGYSFEISSYGDYAISKHVFSPDGNTTKQLVGGVMDASQFNAEGSNHIRGDCRGKTLTLVVNGQTIDQSTDSSFANGGGGVLAISALDSNNGIDALFKNFSIKSP